MKKVFCIITTLSLFFQSVFGQEAFSLRNDTLRAARVVSERLLMSAAGEHIVSLPSIRVKVSPGGDFDIIKQIQTLPGVSVGAEGSSSIYARGGNIGNNLITIDGIPIYGSSHLLGLTTAFPSEILASATFRLGGFHGRDNNLTASHIDLRTRDGDFHHRNISAQASNFLLGGSFSGPIVQGKVSFIGSLRLSPVAHEYRLLSGILPGPLDSLRNVGAMIYDLFGKTTYEISPRQRLSLTLFHSHDSYKYAYSGGDHHMGWSNFVLHAEHSLHTDSGWTIQNGIAFNRFLNRQGVFQEMSHTINDLSIISSLSEISSDILLSKSIGRNGLFQAGASSRVAWFNPGSSSNYEGVSAFTPSSVARTDHRSKIVVNNINMQYDIGSDAEWYHLMASAKANIILSYTDPDGKARFHMNPEGSVLLSVRPFKWFALEGTADWAVQYYHTLEGLPLGWSLDIMIPADSKRGPEKSGQLYGGLRLDLKKHHVNIGAFVKRMSGLLYFKDASRLFSSSLSGWSGNLDVGEGSSRGVEFLYDKEGERVQWQISYTLSKTDRLFPTINRGERFPAKFDRRHIINTSLMGTIFEVGSVTGGFTFGFTYQSGHHETVAIGEYIVTPPFGGEWFSVDFYGGTNNYQMPHYMRMDAGIYAKIDSRRQHTIKLGVYNLLNRHNPFTIMYDSSAMEWRTISLLPIMPNFSYSIEF
ncbi:MAG: hypothetical protein IJ584_08775 [Bacteroidales bacterium]|nr:hypothetical protein [Bacteroidales bacterium]